MSYLNDYKSMLDSLTVNETVSIECSDGITREFKSSTISGSTQLHNSNGILLTRMNEATTHYLFIHINHMLHARANNKYAHVFQNIKSNALKFPLAIGCIPVQFRNGYLQMKVNDEITMQFSFAIFKLYMV